MNEETKEEMCVFCGEEKGQVEIMSPNMDEDNVWNVCIPCSKIIPQMQGYSMGEMIGDKLLSETCKNKIEEIAYEADKEVFCAEIKIKKGVIDE